MFSPPQFLSARNRTGCQKAGAVEITNYRCSKYTYTACLRTNPQIKILLIPADTLLLS
nr:MAG TPA: hypothetical protein [Caudoviricetes sp.]